jgi:glyoxylase-like metal-dependent hydrolase (beta-lactamase superfamily II)
MSREEIRPIDVRHLGRPRVIASWLVGDVLIDPGPASSIDALLEGLGDTVPRAIALTHIHLDHAGATGTLVKRWPTTEVWVHERGAPHLIDPSRLLESATRLYGEDMDRLWGEVLPVPEGRVTVLTGGENIAPFNVAYTPGHASHHVSYLHESSGTAFVGDVAGVRVEPLDYVLAPTPPPDIDIEAWHASIALIREWRPQRLALTHFGATTDPQGSLDRLELALDRWAQRARETDRETFTTELREDIVASVGPEDALCYQQGAPFGHVYDGLERYWRKRAQA